MQSFWGFRFRCCTAQNDAAPSNKEEPLSADDDDKCPICLEPICGEKPVSPQCNHKFHGQCLVTALLQNPRCPVCRYSPLAADDLSDSDDGFVTRGEGYARAIERVQTDKSIAKLATTEKKWNKERLVRLMKLRKCKKKLKLLRRAMKEKVKDYKTELELEFKKANSKLLEEERAAKNEYDTAAAQHCAARTRIAKKGGYVPPRR